MNLLKKSDRIDYLKTVIQFPHTIMYIFIDENMIFMNRSETAGIIGKIFRKLRL